MELADHADRVERILGADEDRVLPVRLAILAEMLNELLGEPAQRSLEHVHCQLRQAGQPLRVLDRGGIDELVEQAPLVRGSLRVPVVLAGVVADRRVAHSLALRDLAQAGTLLGGDVLALDLGVVDLGLRHGVSLMGVR